MLKFDVKIKNNTRSSDKKGSSLVKTIRFKKYGYIGDPCNTVRIFNELEVDELSILDIDASRKNKKSSI